MPTSKLLAAVGSVWPSRRLVLAGASVLLSLAACKESTLPNDRGDDVDDLPVIDSAVVEKETTAADAAYLKKNADFFFRVFDDTFTRKFDDLPAEAEVPNDKKPYYGSYYGEAGGGTNVAMTGGKSPLQKYDQAFAGGQDRASAWEREKHSSKDVSWAGHCNGLAAASQRHPVEPKKSVVRNGVTFDRKDIKALLAEIYMSADYEFLGGNRCEGNVESRANRKPGTEAVMGTCEDINPGTFHAAMANWVGRKKYPLILDLSANLEVWNHPMFKYVTLEKRVLSETEARQWSDGNNGGDYVFNPAAVKFVYVKTRITYTHAPAQEVLDTPSPREQDLAYILELDANGDILGGEWIGESAKQHPDFMWVALEPAKPNGTRYMGNPYIDSDTVIKMWAESVNLDPNNPPVAMRRPLSDEQWGRWPAFDVVLDGNTMGAVFAGKSTNLRVKRKGELAGAGISLDVGMNGTPLATVRSSGDEDLSVTFKPGLGLNRLQLTFKKNGTVAEDQFLRFDVVR